MKIHFLGTSSGCPSLSRNVSATGVQLDSTKSWLLVDCGEGTQHQIAKSQLNAYHLSTILITHIHGDHCYGLPGLLASISMSGRKELVTLIAPQAIIDFVLNCFELTEMEPGFELVTQPWEAITESVSAPGCEIEIMPLQHRVPSVGFKITETDVPRKLKLTKLAEANIESGPHFNALQKGIDVMYVGQQLKSEQFTYFSWRPRCIIICGDNDKPSLLENYVDGVDVLVHEATFMRCDLLKIAHYTGHSDAQRIAEFAQKVAVPTLVLFHFSSRYHGEGMLQGLEREAKTYFHNELVLAYDGLVFDVAKHKNESELCD